MHVKLRVFCSACDACMQVCVPRGGHSLGHGEHRLNGEARMSDVCLFVCVYDLLGRANAACPDGCMHAYGVCDGVANQVHVRVYIHTCSVYVFSWPRFQSLEVDGGGTRPRGVHMVREMWIEGEAWRLDGELMEGLSESGLGVNSDLGVE